MIPSFETGSILILSVDETTTEILSSKWDITYNL